MQRNVFSFWLGPLGMSESRKAAFLSIVQNNACANVHLRDHNVKNWIHPSFPLHPLFPLLSAVHQSDYLRCYFLHVYGGGYTDIKHTRKNWMPFFDALDRSAAYGLGYTEVSPQGVARVGGDLELEMQRDFSSLIGFCAMIFRPQTEFTFEWFDRVNKKIDEKAELLIRCPAKHPQDRLGAVFEGGYVSEYPFAWTEIGGNVFHPMAYSCREKIIHADIAPEFVDYR